jgi:hypothetical protein
VTKAAAGMEQLVNQFAKGDRHARRDLFDLVSKLGVDLTMGQGNTIEKALAAEDEALLADYRRRQGGGCDQRGTDADPSQLASPAPPNPGEE